MITKKKLMEIISEYMPHRWAELIEPLAEEIMEAVKEDKEVSNESKS